MSEIPNSSEQALGKAVPQPEPEPEQAKVEGEVATEGPASVEAAASTPPPPPVTEIEEPAPPEQPFEQENSVSNVEIAGKNYEIFESEELAKAAGVNDKEWILAEDYQAIESYVNHIHYIRIENGRVVGLDFGSNSIDIPSLPAGLKELWAYSVKNLPELPAGLKELHANSVKNLPELPAGLKELWANSVKNLPELPAGLEELHASSVKNLPELPAGLEELHANSVKNLPELPAGLKELHAKSAVIDLTRLKESHPQLSIWCKLEQDEAGWQSVETLVEAGYTVVKRGVAGTPSNRRLSKLYLRITRRKNI